MEKRFLTSVPQAQSFELDIGILKKLLKLKERALGKECWFMSQEQGTLDLKNKTVILVDEMVLQQE